MWLRATMARGAKREEASISALKPLADATFNRIVGTCYNTSMNNTFIFVYTRTPSPANTQIKHTLSRLPRPFPNARVRFMVADEAGSDEFCNRPVGRELCRLVRPGDVIIIAAMAEAFPFTKDLIRQTTAWKRAGVFVAFLDGLFGESLGEQLDACKSLAESEAEKRSQWQKDMRREAKAIGRWLGPQPFGTSKVAKSSRPGRGHLLKPDHRSLLEAALCQHLRNDRGWTYSEIALELSRAKRPSLTPFDFAWKSPNAWPISIDQVQRRIACPGAAVERFCAALAQQCREITQRYVEVWREKLGNLEKPIVPSHFRLRRGSQQGFSRPPIRLGVKSPRIAFRA